jgi:L-ascorbate metabolism protein UlaG (beta-lactamase superfamily)
MPQNWMPLEITWLGHATVLIELDGTRVLTDPVLGTRVGGLVRIAPPVSPAQATGIDVVLVSHLHADHADAASLRRAGASATVLGPPGAGRWLERQGLARVQELLPGEEFAAGPLHIHAVPAVHEGRRHPLADPSGSIGFLVRGSCSLYFAGDTDLFPEMADIAAQLDVALLPVSGWGPTLGPGHLDPRRAAQAAALLTPRVAIPIHWGTLGLPLGFARPADPERPARDFETHVARLAPEVEVRVLAPGERTTLD